MALLGNFNSLPLLTNPLGSHDSTLVDTGVILGETDPRPNTALIDLDVDGGERSSVEDGAVSIGLLPEISPGKALIDADVLSGSYGAGDAVVVDVGPDGFGPVLTGTVLADAQNPIDLNLFEVPVSGVLQGQGGDSLVGNVLEDVQTILPVGDILPSADILGGGANSVDLDLIGGLQLTEHLDHGLLGA